MKANGFKNILIAFNVINQSINQLGFSNSFIFYNFKCVCLGLINILNLSAI